MYFEIIRDNKIIKRGRDALNYPTWDTAPMTVPSTMLTLPIYYHEFITGRDEVRIYIDDKCFWGIVVRIDEDKANESIDVNLEHIVHEWTYRQISVNNAIKEGKINFVYKGAETETVGNTSVTASPFDILLEEVGTFTSQMYIERAGASAWTSDGEMKDVTVDFSAVESKAGDYDVIFTSGEASVTVKATVKESDEEAEGGGYKLTASSFSMYGTDVGTIDYIEAANATVEPSAEIKVDASNVKTTSGTYSVTFSVEYEEDGETETVEVTVDAIVVGEGEEASVVDNIGDIYADSNFAYPGWTLEMSDKAKDTTIDYVYSRQNKLEALNKTMELTEDLFWRVKFVPRKVLEIGEFGEKKNYIFSTKPTGDYNIRIVTEPTIKHSFDHVINVATVYSEKSDSGMSSMTLREIYMNPDLQKDGFPVVILRSNANNERNYKAYTYQYPKLAPNNELEYAVIDEESVALEGGHIIEGTFAFNDLAPFSVVDDNGDTKEITDEDRVEAATTAYEASIRKLIEARRRYELEQDMEKLPVELNVGDKVRELYSNSILIQESCSKYLKHILTLDDWYYITSIDYGEEVDTVTLEKFLRLDREISKE